MNTRDFLKQVWPATGNFCIAVPHINQLGKKGYKHSVHDNTTDAYLDARARYREVDIYFGIFTHINQSVYSQKWNRNTPSRKRENMDKAKCLFLDLDVSKGKGTYDTQADALGSLTRFLFRTGLPAPIVVSSGNGLHVYWPLKDAVEADRWRPHAANLRTILDEHRVMYDPSRTTDITSVLRMPSTLNHKDPADIKDVKILYDGDGESDNAALFGLLTSLGGHAQPVAIAPSVDASGLPVNIGIGSNFPPTDPDDVANECEQVRMLRDQNGNIPEPQWYTIAGVLAYCTDGEQAFHRWSSGHPNYTQAEAQAKLEQWKANGSVTSCAKLNSDGAQGVCQRCPHFGSQYKNPIVIVNKKPVMTAFVAPAISAPAPAIPPCIVQPPRPYIRAQGLDILRQDPTTGVNTTIIAQYDLYPIDVSPGVNRGVKLNSGTSTWVATTNTNQGHFSTLFDVPGNAIVNKEKLAEVLFSNGLFFPMNQGVPAYMSAYLKKLHAEKGFSEQHNHIGWGSKALDKFILNKTIIDSTGKVTPCIMAHEAEIGTDGLTKGGNIQGQLNALKFYDDPSYAPHKLMILCSLANPLFMATGHHGVTVNASGESAASKSTTLRAAAGIWGNPTKFIVNGTNRGMTSLARELRAMVLLNLPTCLDEITHMDPDDARTMVMTWTQPSLRTTLTANRTVRESRITGHRSAYLLSTSNSSLHQVVNADSQTAGTANSARVMQLIFDRAYMVHTKGEADEALLEFDTHYGWLGEHFMVKAMPSMPHLFDSVRRMVRRIDADTNASPIMRFLSAAAAPAFVAGAYAVYLGLIDWDMDALYRWFIDVQWPMLVDDMAEQQGHVAYDRVLREFVNAQVNNTITDDGQGNIPPALIKDQVVIHHRTDLKQMWVDLPAFRRWCERRGTPMTNLMTAMHKDGIVTVKETRKHLGEGTRYCGSRNVVFIVDTDALNR